MTKKDMTFSERKRLAVIKAASRLFLEKGYGSVSMDAVAEAAGVSKKTIYNHFSGKAVLFSEVIRLTWAEMEPPVLSADSGLGIREDLMEFTLKLLKILRSEKFTKMLRLVIGESGRFPELTEMYGQNSLKPFLKTLSEYFTEKSDSGELLPGDPMLGSMQYLGMVKESLFWPVLLGVIPKPGPERDIQLISQAIDIILKIYSPDNK